MWTLDPLRRIKERTSPLQLLSTMSQPYPYKRGLCAMHMSVGVAPNWNDCSPLRVRPESPSAVKEAVYLSKCSAYNNRFLSLIQTHGRGGGLTYQNVRSSTGSSAMEK